MNNRLKRIFSDSMFSVVGMVTMNMVAQFILYPAWNRQLGSERYGDILYLLSLMNIFAISAGSGMNYARMRASVNQKTNNTPYLVLMGALSLLALPLGSLIARYAGVRFTAAELLSYILLVIATMWRFYDDVEFRLTLNYKSSFCYYLCISAGYLFGILIFHVCGLWPVALLLGELAGFIYILCRGNVVKPDVGADKAETVSILRVFILLVASEMVSSLIFNSDRILLKTLLGGAAVTVYYLASLLGKTISLISTPLNSVIMGYLSRFKGHLSIRMVGCMAAACLLAIPLLALCCTVASMILIALLYPQEYAQAKSYFFIGNAAQVTYFLANIVSVVLLRFAKAYYPMLVNAAYAILFCALCIPATIYWGIPGFCAGLLTTNVLRLLLALGLCLSQSLSDRKMERV